MPSEAAKRKRPSDATENPATSGPSKCKAVAVSKSRSKDSRKIKRDTEESEIQDLEQRVVAFAPPKEYGRFDQLPISRKTAQGECDGIDNPGPIRLACTWLTITAHRRSTQSCLHKADGYSGKVNSSISQRP